MDVKAILIVPSNLVAGTAPALMDVLGSSVLQRTIDRLRAEIDAEITVLAETGMKTGDLRHAKVISVAPGTEWRTAEHIFEEHAQGGADVVLLAHANAYSEVDWAEMLDHHLSSDSRITRLHHGQEPLDIFFLKATRRNEAAALLRSEMHRSRSECSCYYSRELYWPVQTAGDLRALAVDALFRRCRLEPVGKEVRPGVWIGRDAFVERGARLVAPVYVGERSRIYTGAVITRASALEHHCTVDCGTVIENSTIAPYSFVGAGLDLVSVVVGNQRLHHLRRNLEIDMPDRRLVRAVSSNAGVRLLASTGSLISLLPALAFTRLRSRRPATPPLPRGRPAPVHAINETESNASEPKRIAGLAPGYAGMRRYGNQ